MLMQHKLCSIDCRVIGSLVIIPGTDFNASTLDELHPWMPDLLYKMITSFFQKKDSRLNRRNSSNSSLGSRDENATTGGQSSDKWSTARSSLKSQSSGRRTAASKKRNTAK